MSIYYKKASTIFLCGLFSIFLTASVSGQNMFRKTMDFDGDGKADFAITRNAGGYKYWYIWQSTQGFRVSQFGFDTDQNAPGDYDGDGKFDLGAFRQTSTAPSSSYYSFWILGSQVGGQLQAAAYFNTLAGCVPNQQDYDGDGKTDAAWTWGNSTTNARDPIFYVHYSGINYPAGVITSGGDFIRIGDMTGDGKADVSGITSATNVVSIRNSANSSSVQTIQFGVAGDEFVPADFDGDGKGDMTVFRQTDGTWWWMRSSDNIVQAATFGTSGDIPVPADYDGDGKTDLAIWRSGSGQSYFWVYGSQVGVFALPWGVVGDRVVRY